MLERQSVHHAMMSTLFARLPESSGLTMARSHQKVKIATVGGRPRGPANFAGNIGECIGRPDHFSENG
jgi:hypothetical protein